VCEQTQRHSARMPSHAQTDTKCECRDFWELSVLVRVLLAGSVGRCSEVQVPPEPCVSAAVQKARVSASSSPRAALAAAPVPSAKKNWLEYTTPGLAGLIRVTLGVRVGVLHVLKCVSFHHVTVISNDST
jgi:hypothetical protein